MLVLAWTDGHLGVPEVYMRKHLTEIKIQFSERLIAMNCRKVLRSSEVHDMKIFK